MTDAQRTPPSPAPPRRRSASAGPSAGAAFALIVTGAVFLLRNLDILPRGGSWWAWLLLVPLGFLGARILELRERSGGGFPLEARGTLAGFLAIALVMAVFLLDLNWGEVWPVFIILVGVSFLLGSSPARRSTPPPADGGGAGR